MTKKSETTTNETADLDRLASLVTNDDLHSKTSKTVSLIQHPKVRDYFADLIEANISDPACRQFISRLAHLSPDILDKVLTIVSLSNSSALRKALITDGGFRAPSGSSASIKVGMIPDF